MARRSKAGGKATKGGRSKAAIPGHAIPPKAEPSRRSATATTGQETEAARLTRERDEALEREKAVAEVLKLISRPTFDLTKVLNTLLESAAHLCEADRGAILRPTGKDGSYFVVASYRHASEFYEYVKNLTFAPGRSGVVGRVLLEGRSVHIADVLADPEYALLDIAKVGDYRTILGVPLLREGMPVGIFLLQQAEVRPFTPKQIELVENFTAQAVIAMENARLLTETREALDRQTATTEVLQAINLSPGNLGPVFDTMLEKAMRLCAAAFGVLWAYEGGRFRAAAVHGAPPAFVEFLREPLQPHYHPETGLERALRGENLVINDDMSAEEAYQSSDPMRRAIVDLGGARSHVLVALRKDDALLGAITIYRQEVLPFTDKQIALLQNFAAQAVIAMENARLLVESRDRQAELRVTFDNMGDGVVMFDAEARLAAWNRNFQEILDLPEAFLAQRPTYVEYFSYLAERGEYPSDLEQQLSRTVEDTRREIRLERTRPDGRVIEVRRNPVPDGGFVMIYADITQRKRAEQAIRAARDAAEIALRDLQAAQASLVHAQKMAALGQLTAGIAHEIKNPLNFVNNFAGLSVDLLEELKGATAEAIGVLDSGKRTEILETIGMLTGNLEKIVEHGRRADGIVRGMLQHSRGSSGDWQTANLNTLVEESSNLAYHNARAQDQDFKVSLELDLDRNLAPIEVVSQDLSRVLLNLISNGFYAVTKRGREGNSAFSPVLKIATREYGEGVEIRVCDNGVGIPPEHCEKLFQPFFTTKPTGEGTGLGLSISYEIITQQHGGTIKVDSQVGGFTEFTVRLPRRRHGVA